MTEREIHNKNSWRRFNYPKQQRIFNNYSYKPEENLTLLRIGNYNDPQRFDTTNVDEEKNLDSSEFCLKRDDSQQETENKISTHYVSIFWDLESCPPSGKPISLIVKILQDKFATQNCKLSFSIVSSSYRINASLVDNLLSQGIEVVHKGHQDIFPTIQKMLCDQVEAVLSLNSVMYSIIMISNNPLIIRELKYQVRDNIKLILFCDEIMDEYHKFTSEIHVFNDILKSLAKNKKLIGRLVGEFRNSDLKYLKNYIDDLFSNYGYVRVLSTKEAIIHFPNLETAYEAKERFDGIRIAGYRVSLILDCGGGHKDKESVYLNEPKIKQKAPSRFSACVFISIKFDKELSPFDYNGCCEILRKIFSVNFDLVFKNYVKISQSELKVQVFVESVNKAKIIYKKVESWNKQAMEDPMPFLVYASLKSEPNELERRIHTRKVEVLQNLKQDCASAFKSHSMKHTRLTDQLSDLQERLDKLNLNKVSDLKLASSLADEKETLNSKIQEINEQEEEFSNFITEIFLNIEALGVTSTFESKLSNQILSFTKELNYFKNILPIYAKRSLIIETIKDNPVCVLLAETGSGKSTQLAQYLYQFDIHQGKQIVCTQPRKIAATSLATFVSSQMGTSVGSLVGYKTGLKNKSCAETAIVYMTDQTLLNECLQDPLLSCYSCIIIDEAHERSVNTDLLIGMLKTCLAQRNDLKVIITSATIDPQKFVNFFESFNHCPVIDVPGRIFPVEIEYVPQAEDFKGDYIKESIKLVEKIHKHEEMGDILVFLTSPLETEKASTSLASIVTDRSLLILQLHGRLQLEEQHNVFKPAPPGRRKIVFATNSAETSITIPGIRYVIDSGLVKEKKFEPKTNRSALIIGPISKSAAEQRKGRAGRMQPGKCFRLYSKDSYEKLDLSMLPEILRINLGQAILKLMELGVKNPLEFDFVDAPSPVAFNAAFEGLIDLKAIENGSLSELGLRMAKLPLEPRLAKLVLLGLESGIPLETMIVASIATSPGIYFRMGSEEEIKRSDLQRIQSSMPEGDLISMLELFIKWWKIEERKKGTWCRDNWLNGKTMKNARETMSELEKIIKKEFNMKFTHDFVPDKKEVYEKLRRNIFKCFYRNLCIFSGHEKTGYITLNDYKFVQIHPSSSLSYLKKLDVEYIVYDQQLTTSRDFILNMTPIPFSWVDEYMKKGLLNFDAEKVEKMKFLKQSFKPYGSYVLKKHIIGARGSILFELEDSLKRMMIDDNIKLEANISNGEVNAYVPVESNASSDVLQPVLDYAKDELKNVTQAIPLSDNQGFNMQGILMRGFQLSDVILQGEFREIIVRNVQESQLLEDVIKDFSSFGDISHYFERQEKDETTSVIIIFFLPKSAKEAVENTRTDELLVQPRGKLFSPRSSNSFQMRMYWSRRQSRGHGFLNFKNYEHLNIACISGALEISSEHPLADASSSCGLTLRRNRRRGGESLLVSPIPTYVSSNDLLASAKRKFPSYPIDTAFVVHAAPFITSREDYDVVLRDIKREFEELDIKEENDVNLLIPKNHSVNWVAFLHFEAANKIQAVFNAFNKKVASFSQGNVVFLEPKLQVKIFINSRIFDFIKDPLEEVMSSLNDDDSKKRTLTIFKGKKPKDKICISIDTNNLDDLCKIVGPISELTTGKRLTIQNAVTFNILRTTALHPLKEIENQFGVYIQLDFRTTSLSIFGKHPDVQSSIDQIKRLIEELEAGNHFEISLSQAKGLLKSLIVAYGPALEMLIQETGLQTLKINVNRHILTGTGTYDAHTKLCDIIQEHKEKLPPPYNLCTEADEICPICMMPVLPGLSSYRLQYCGHLHCIECIGAQLQQKTVPIRCSAESCGEFFVLEDFKFLINTDGQLYKDLLNSAIQDFVTTNNRRVSFCPVADCQGIFRINAESSKYFCQACRNDICTRCKVLFHHGISCEIYQSGFSEADPSLRDWLKQDPANHKLCSNCSSPIEKIDGCDHMTCTRCQAHLCWLCLKVFPSGADTYRHIPYCQRNA